MHPAELQDLHTYVPSSFALNFSITNTWSDLLCLFGLEFVMFLLSLNHDVVGKGTPGRKKHMKIVSFFQLQLN